MTNMNFRKVLKFKKSILKEEEDERSDKDMNTETRPAGIDVVSLTIAPMFCLIFSVHFIQQRQIDEVGKN